MIAALVPVKALAESKSRLARALPRGVTRRLSVAMLEDVLEALGAAPGLGRVAVVTPDADVAEASHEAGAEALVLGDVGLNASLDAAARQLAEAGAHGVLVVLGDVPGVRPEELGAMLTALTELGGRGAVLAPSRDGGSAALLRAPHDVVPSCFGEDSAARHREAAHGARVPWRELRLAGLEIDLDRPEDLEAFLARPGGGRRTRQLLETLAAGRPA